MIAWIRNWLRSRRQRKVARHIAKQRARLADIEAEMLPWKDNPFSKGRMAPLAGERAKLKTLIAHNVEYEDTL